MKLYVAALYGLAAIGGFAFASHMSHDMPNGRKTASSPAKLKNLLREGDIEGTMEAARELLKDLKAVNWDPYKLPRERFRVPDQDYAEDSVFRAPDIPTFFPALDPAVYGPVAFHSPLYVRRNVRVTPGVEAVTHPEGFCIVAYKNGDIKKIPVGQVRVGPKDSKGYQNFCYPGMPNYSEDLPRIPGS